MEVKGHNQLQVLKKYQPKVKTKFSDNLKAHLLKALAVDPKFSEAHFQMALMYQEDGDRKMAEAHFNKAIESDNQQTLEIEKRSEELLRKFQFQNAKILFIKAQEKKLHCAKVYFQLSSLYEYQNKLAKAETCLKKSITLNPASSKAHRNLGILFSQQKSYDVARLHIEKALDLNYSDCLSHLNLGIIMKQSKDYVDAEIHFLSALDINPKYVVCMLEMAHLQLIMNNQKKAKKYYKKAQNISPNIKDVDLGNIL